MADLSDVQDALRGIIVASVYPNVSPPSITGTAVKVYPGWPNPQTLDTDAKAGICHVSIFPRTGDKDSTRQSTDWQEVSRNTASYGLAVSGQTITVTGAAPNPFVAQNALVMINGLPIRYQPTAGQTASQVAAALAALITGATVSGAVITIRNIDRIGAARIGVTGHALRVVRNQIKQFQITIWAPSNALRIALAKAIDPVLSDTPRLDLADGTVGKLTYQSSTDFDGIQRQGWFCRDLFYSVDYATTRADQFEEIVSSELDLSNPAPAAISPLFA